MFDVISYIMGMKTNEKKLVIDGDKVSLTYEDGSVTLTKEGGDENG